MTTQITDLAALAGKTIAKAVELEDRHYAGYLGIVFTDGSYLYLRAAPGSGVDPSVDWTAKPVEDGHKAALGDERLRAKFEGGPKA